jgi:hypothetical protein
MAWLRLLGVTLDGASTSEATGLTGLTGVRRSLHPYGMQGRVRRSVGRLVGHPSDGTPPTP